MYRCEICKKVLPSGTPQVRLVIETREKTYDVTPTLNEKEQRRARRRGMNIEQQRQFALGWEIKQEVVVCPNYRECLADRPELTGALDAQLEAHAERKLGTTAGSAEEAAEPAPVSVTVGPESAS